MPSPNQLLPPDVYHGATIVWQRAQEKRNPTTADTTLSLGTASLLGVLDTSVREAKAAGRTGFDILEDITNPETAQAFERSLQEATELFARADITVPTLEEMVIYSDNGKGEHIDLARLAGFYEQMKKDGLMPEIAITPQGLSMDAWRRVYGDMTPECDAQGNITKNAPGMPANNPLKRLNGLYINSSLFPHWSGFNKPTVLRADSTPTPSYTDTDGRHWTIRIIPGTPKPPETGISYGEYKARGGTLSTIAELLAVQGQRIQRGEEPFDSWTITLAEGGVKGVDGRVPCVRWSILGNAIVSWEDVNRPSSIVGARPPLG